MNRDNSVLKTFLSSNDGMTKIKKYISQSDYKYQMLNRVEPYLRENLKCGHITGKNNLNLYYEKFIVENSKANIVICHGFGEVTEKYYELIYYFIKERYSVFIMEHRGHGRSERLGIDNSQINVEKFDYYVEDFKKFIDDIVIPNSNDKSLLLFAHSMGGAIGTIFLEKYTNYFNGAILSSPMHEINTGKVPKILANIISNAIKLCGMELRYLPGQAPYREQRKFVGRSTSCRERYEYLYEKISNNRQYHSGGASVLWYLESVKATKELMKKKNASKVITPTLLFQAECDTRVIPKAHNKFASYASNCKLVHLKKSKHEPYFEIDKITFYFIDEVFSFYESVINNEKLKTHI